MAESPTGFQVWLLAAGSGARAGGPKGLRLVQGKPWLQHQIEAWTALGASLLRLGLGAHYEEHLRLPCLARSACPPSRHQEGQAWNCAATNNGGWDPFPPCKPWLHRRCRPFRFS